MKLPERCPNCKAIFGADIPGAHLIIRTELDFDRADEARIEDQIYECSGCHTLFRAHWQLISFVQLEEVKK